MNDLEKEVERVIQSRKHLDKPVSYLWGATFFFNNFFVLFILSSLGLIVLKTGFTELLLILIVIALLLRLILIPMAIYKISKSIITHFDNSRRERASLIVYGRGKFSEVTNCIVLKSHYEVFFYEKKKSPLAYALISILPFAPTMIIYTLFKSFYIHHIKETSFAMGIRASIDLGSDFIKWAFKLRKEDLTLYVLLSLLSVEVFLVFWVFVALKDFKVHLQFHEKFENEISLFLERSETNITEG